jgi:predicted metalloprotease with PDZ domain
MKYEFSFELPNRQLIDIKFTIENVTENELIVNLPAWRPGRYELGNFAKNIQRLEVFDGEGNALKFRKTKKDSWTIATEGKSTVVVKYNYYGADLNAGSTYLDEHQLYVNPVNCCMYLPQRISEPCTLILHVPETYKIASDLPLTGNDEKVRTAADFHRLADAPFIASDKLQHGSVKVENHTFHLWFMGIVQPDWEKLNKDFERFCLEQLQTMGNLPGLEYHFMFQVLPMFYYHGVEHTYSTVCALGPGETLFNTAFYDELLGVSSHELFHAWNVKTIRPNDMLPYNYEQENYSELGWVYEGVTTYFGDQFLLRSGVFDFKRWTVTFDEKLRKHFTNYARFTQPVAQASFDTWLDGYVPGIPHRKTSIYTEGSLISFILDGILRQRSNNEKSLDDFMRLLNADAQAGLGYSKEVLIGHLNSLVAYDFKKFYEHYIEQPNSLEPLIQEYLENLGLEMQVHLPFNKLEHKTGMLLAEVAGFTTIHNIAPNSPAEIAGLMIGDQIIAINSLKVKNNLLALWNETEQFELEVYTKSGRTYKAALKIGNDTFFEGRKVAIKETINEVQEKNWLAWSKQQFPKPITFDKN